MFGILGFFGTVIGLILIPIILAAEKRKERKASERWALIMEEQRKRDEELNEWHNEKMRKIFGDDYEYNPYFDAGDPHRHPNIRKELREKPYACDCSEDDAR